jgi:manganese transport protein
MDTANNISGICPGAVCGARGSRPSAARAALKRLGFLGPAFIVSVAYVDPGNFSANISGGSKYGYALLWVLMWSNIMAIFLQTMSAKVGIATGRSLPEMCARLFSRRTNIVFWIIAELAAMATDLAEFLGGTLGFYLLFGMPMLWAGLLTGLITFLICALEKYGQRTVEAVITALIAVICACYLTELFLSRPDPVAAGLHTLVPSLPDGGAVLIAVGMLGATVMPHVVYLHSALVQSRSSDRAPAALHRQYRLEKIDIVVAMNMAFFVNAAMVLVSAAVFGSSGTEITSIEQAGRSLEPLLGPLSGGAFGIALAASGLSSSAVGTLAGQSIMKGFINVNIPVNLRRLITMLPALIIIALGVSPMYALLISQVALSFILPVPIIQLLIVANRRDVMGDFTNTPLMRRTGTLIASAVTALNAALLVCIFLGLV